MAQRFAPGVGVFLTALALAGTARAQQERPEDRAAIDKASQSFVKAFESGDAKAVAAHWTPEGEFIAEDGRVIRGRDQLEKVYGEMFKKSGSLKVTLEMESLRFTSKNTAIEEGYMKVAKGKSAESTSSRYSVLHVREDGQWLMAVVRDWPSEGVALRDLDWLIGSWASNSDDIDVRTTYQWELNKNFIRGQFSIKSKDHTVAGIQVIAKDPSTGTIRSWTFESEGGFGHAVWTREGTKWTQEAEAVLAGGSLMSATNVLNRLDADSFSFQSVERTVDELPLPDTAPVKVVRVKATN